MRMGEPSRAPRGSGVVKTHLAAGPQQDLKCDNPHPKSLVLASAPLPIRWTITEAFLRRDIFW